MKPEHAAFTLVELLATMTVAALLALLLSQLLRSQQTAVQGASEREALAVHERALWDDLLTTLGQARLFPHQASPATPAWVIAPAANLLPDAPGLLSGHAIFLQSPGRDANGILRLQNHGFYVAYSDDRAWRPGFIQRSHHAFRLLHWRGGDESLRQLATTSTDPAWFAPGAAERVTPVAEHVLALFFSPLETSPSLENENSAGTPSTALVEIAICLASPMDWAKLTDARRTSLAKRVQQLTVDAVHAPSGPEKEALRQTCAEAGVRIVWLRRTVSLPARLPRRAFDD